MKRIQSRLHRIGTYNDCKISLSCFDDKRFVLDDGVNTLAYFHKDKRLIISWFYFDEIGKDFMELIKTS